MREVVCPYKDKCTGYRIRCSRCKKNTGKRDYFEPEYVRPMPQPQPYIPPHRPYQRQRLWRVTG